MNNILTTKKIKGIPKNDNLMAEFEMDGPDQNTHGFQITTSGNSVNMKDFFSVYTDNMGDAELIGKTDRMSKAIEIIAKYVQIQVVDEDDAIDQLDDDSDSDEEDLNKWIVQHVEDNHKICLDDKI